MTSLRAQLRQVRQRLGELLYRQQQMLLVSGPNLEARYHSLLGRLDLELLQAQVENRRLKRQIELCRSHLARLGAIDTAAIAETLNGELSVWREQIRKGQERFEESEKRLGSLASPEISAAVRSLYRQLVKRLHPDLNPQMDDHRRQLWHAVQQAYQGRDWRRMETLLAATDDDDWKESPEELVRLESRYEELATDLARMQKQFPHRLERELEDPQWLQKREGELKLMILLEQQRSSKLRAVLSEYW